MSLANLEDVRHDAIASLATVEPLAAEALRRGEPWSRARTTWQGTNGTITGVVVGLAVDAGMLGDLHAHPHAIDALVEAVSAAVATHAPAHSLLELRVHWSGGAMLGESAYRGAVRAAAGARDLGTAVGEYLRAGGYFRAADASATAIRRVETKHAGGAIDARLSLDEELPRDLADAIERAVAALLPGPDGEHVRIVR